MKVLFIVLMMCCSIFGLGSTQSIFAADLEAGEQIFTANCAACHAGGNNLILPEKTLQKEVLEQNGMRTVTAITNQVTNGKNAMPAFSGRLAEEDIDNVANYVLDKCEQGW